MPFTQMYFTQRSYSLLQTYFSLFHRVKLDSCFSCELEKISKSKIFTPFEILIDLFENRSIESIFIE